MMTYEYLYNPLPDVKMKMMEFVYKNTDSFILNTFGYLWESRGWWDVYPVQVIKLNNDIVGLHAFSTNTKGPGIVKTYYIVTSKSLRGQGMAKKLILQALKDSQYNCDKYMVNSEENSSGVGFFKKMFKDKFTLTKNEFGTLDYNFEAPIKQLILENE